MRCGKGQEALPFLVYLPSFARRELENLVDELPDPF